MSVQFYVTGISVGAICLAFLSPPVSSARENSLTGGVSVTYDYNTRSQDKIADDRATTEDESLQNSNRDRNYRSITITPLVKFISRSERDSLELRAAPGLKYDLKESETNWDYDLYVGANRFFTRAWQIRLSDSYIKTDYFQTGFSTDQGATSSGGSTVTESSDELSPDLGRRRYWTNTLSLFSDYTYWEDSLFQVGARYVALRNDDTGVNGYDDYDRYTLSLRNEHRFTSIWKTITDLSFVRGEFDTADEPAVSDITGQDIQQNTQLSDDVKEYRATVTVENNSFTRNTLSLMYNYVGSRYDDDALNDGDIHQLRFTWRKDYSPHVYTVVGLGPSYQKTEGREADWGANGTAEWNYILEQGRLNFLLDKRYDVNNFSGNGDRGFVDTWETRFSFNHNLLENIGMNGFLSYIYENRKSPGTTQDAAVEADQAQLEEFYRNRYSGGLGFSYSFMKFYSVGLNYIYTKLDSERTDEEYDDHRVFITFSWNRELYRW
ncbi:hypothetical protein [Desulfomarina sp.]